MEKKKFMIGALVLTLSGLLCKALGAVYRIPLGNTIGTEGMGYYQMAYPLYSFLIMLSSAGIPVALSKLVSEECACGRATAANEIFHTSRSALALLGAGSAVLLFAVSGPAARLMGLPGTAFSLKMLAPSLIFVAVVSAYRGGLQGRQLMGATAVSQVVEQLTRLTVGLQIAAAWAPGGAEFGAGGALLGVTLSELAGLSVVMGYYAAKRRSFLDVGVKVSRERRREILGRIFRIALPVTLGGCAVSAVSAIDSVVVMRVMTANGFAKSEATGLFGLLTGFVQPIVNMPAVLSGAVAMSIVPVISAACARGDRCGLCRRGDFAYKLALILGIPCAAGVLMLARPLLSAIYPSLSEEDLSTAAQMMRVMAPGIALMSVSQVATGILQGVDRAALPVLSVLMGAAVKLFLGIWLIRMPSLNIMGAAWGTLLYCAVNALTDTLFARNCAGISAGLRKNLPGICLCTAGMCGVILLVRRCLRLNVWLTVLAGMAGYAILLLLTKTVDAEELRCMLPRRCGGRKILRTGRES